MWNSLPPSVIDTIKLYNILRREYSNLAGYYIMNYYKLFTSAAVRKYSVLEVCTVFNINK